MIYYQISLLVVSGISIFGWGIEFMTLISLAIPTLIFFIMIGMIINARKHKSYPVILQAILSSRIYKDIYKENKVKIFLILTLPTSLNKKEARILTFFLIERNVKSQMKKAICSVIMEWKEDNKRWEIRVIFLTPIEYITKNNIDEISYVNEDFE
jgi:late competence protein required for DNA uptake (superfamily II DNA/RNA helicase)